MDKNFLVVTNIKANLLPTYDLKIPDKIEVAIAASFPFIKDVPEQFSRAAQDVSSFPMGAYTGEIPAEMLKNLNVKYCLVGHSERRKYLHETNDLITLKIEALKAQNIIPIICAQSWEEIPEGILRYTQDDTYVMYEPFSAISQNGSYNPEPEEQINQTLIDWKVKLPEGTRFLYGGSVNPDNCQLLIANCPLVSGFVIGHAALDPQTLGTIVNSIA